LRPSLRHVGVVAAFSKAIEAVARGDDPSLGGARATLKSSEIFEDGEGVGGKRSES